MSVWWIRDDGALSSEACEHPEVKGQKQQAVETRSNQEATPHYEPTVTLILGLNSRQLHHTLVISLEC